MAVPAAMPGEGVAEAARKLAVVPPRRRPPDEFLVVLDQHRQAAHGLSEVDPRRVGKPGSRSTSLEAVWHHPAAEEDWRGAWVECRHCPEGFGRYLLDVDQPAPSPRLWPLVEQHFADRHPELVFFDQSMVGTRTRPHPDQKAFYLPPHAEGGATITCRVCVLVGRNPIILTDPPYGDARRRRLLARRHPEVMLQIAAWPTADQAAYLDAVDRGLLTQPDPQAAYRALAAVRPAAQARPNTKNEALLGIMLRRTAAGEGIERVIDDLAEHSTYAPKQFACLIGEQFLHAGLLTHRPSDEAEFADLVRQRLDLRHGRYPTASKRTLYRIWKTRPAP